MYLDHIIGVWNYKAPNYVVVNPIDVNTDEFGRPRIVIFHLDWKKRTVNIHGLGQRPQGVRCSRFNCRMIVRDSGGFRQPLARLTHDAVG